MHEGHFTEKIVEAILGELKNHPGGKIKAARVVVGEVYHLVFDSVLMHFEISVRGTPLEGVHLDLREEPMQVSCPKCLLTGPVQDHHMPLCSFCGSLDVKPIGGNSITVDTIEFYK